MNKLFIILFLTFIKSLISQSSYMTNTINIIPKPQEIKFISDEFIFSNSTLIVYEQRMNLVIEELQSFLKNYLGYEIKIANKSDISNAIIFKLTDDEKSTLSDEAYKLLINKEKILIESKSLQGLFYGVQTLKQIIFNRYDKQSDKIKIPSLEIKDYPKFSWRGLNLDCCRHFMSKQYIKKIIDLLALHKMNILHWHLTEDQGWRIEIKKYPELTKIGAYRKYDDGTVYGGYYTQDDVREIIDYASKKFITVVPEIELPGHSTAALATFPNLSCRGKPLEVGTLWGIYQDIYCAGNEDTFNFLENVFSEIIELFPSKYIHIGGDEAPKDRWKYCAKCQHRILTENLKDEYQLQSYFIRRIENFLSQNGKKIIGWDEILEGGLAPGATVQSWRGLKGAIDAAKLGHDVIVSPTSHCYFDYSIDITDLPKVYSFDPIPKELSSNEIKFVLGTEANMWTEYAPEHIVDYRLFPRLTALSEVVWTYPIKRDYSDFQKRLQKFYDLLDHLNVNYSFEIPPLTFNETFDTNMNQFKVEIIINQNNLDLFYTFDNSEPTTSSFKYHEQILINKSTTLKLALFRNGKKIGETLQKQYHISKSLNKKVSFNIPPSDKFSRGEAKILTDGIRGGDNFRANGYIGFYNTDAEIVIDLENTTKVNNILIGFFTASSSLVFIPEYVDVFYSIDGNNFTFLDRVSKSFSLKDPTWKRIDFSLKANNVDAKFLKIFAKNPKYIPDWHPAFGGKVWLMIDELIVE